MTLFVDIQEFARIACLDGRLYGVITRCDTCEIFLNECARNHLLNALQSNQAIVEKLLGYNLTEKYHQEIQDWDGTSLIQTNWPGVEKISVKQIFEDIPGYGPFPISPYIQENLNLIDSGFGFCIAEVDQTLVQNPAHIIIRNDEGTVIETQAVNGYPRRDGGNWQIALGNQSIAPACAETLHAQSCKYMILDVTDHDCGDDSVLTPVYPGTDTPIPQAKPSEDIGGGLRRFWFAPWVLVDSGFYEEEVNLILGEFYKLLPEISFKCVSEVEALPTVYAVSGTNCTTNFSEISDISTDKTKFDLMNSRYGILQMQIKNTSFCQDNKAPFKIEFYYKTNPNSFDLTEYLELIKEAIAYLTAAELPNEVCGCKMETGFIATAQKAYTEIRINPVTGESIVNLEHGNLYGQLVFSEKIARVPVFQKRKTI